MPPGPLIPPLPEGIGIPPLPEDNGEPAEGRPVAAAVPLVDVHPMQYVNFDDEGEAPGEDKNSMELVYDIPLQVTVELGKTHKEISEILEFGMGTIIVLDKLAGDPVEVLANGKLIARGEVVVIDENYGVRITEIVNGK
jgi:flagellar motor switch protein FliN/FliY